METNLTLIDSEMCPKENSYCSKGETGPGMVCTSTNELKNRNLDDDNQLAHERKASLCMCVCCCRETLGARWSVEMKRRSGCCAAAVNGNPDSVLLLRFLTTKTGSIQSLKSLMTVTFEFSSCSTLQLIIESVRPKSELVCFTQIS